MNKVLKGILNASLYIFIILILTYCAVTFLGQRTEVIGSSMEPTLSDGDNLIVDKLTFRLREPERFEIIVFPYQYSKGTYYIKRIIGLPGERIYIDEKGQIFINGELLEEDYGKEVIEDAGLAATEIELGENEYFVMGDNRNDSADSRFVSVGNVDGSNIIGRAWLRIYPFDRFGKLKHQ